MDTPATYYPPPSQTSFACLSLNESDKLRLISFSENAIGAVRTAIIGSWHKGIQEEKNYHGAYQFKLKGNPWKGQGSEAVPSRILMCSVLSCLYNSGWIILPSTDISKKQLDKDTLLFRFQHRQPVPCTWFTISFNEYDRLRLITPPNELITAFKHTLAQEIQKDDWKDQTTYEFKLHGYPWKAEGSEAVTARQTLLKVLQILDSYGYTLYASIDQNTGEAAEEKSSASGSVDSWYCKRENTWAHGAPVYHD